MDTPQASEMAVDSPPDLGEAVARYETPLLRYVAHLLGREVHEAQDIVQEAFLRLYKQASRQGGSIANIRVWLFRVAHNLAMDTGRQRRRTQAARLQLAQQILDDQRSTCDPADALEELALKEAREKALSEAQGLPVEQRSVLMLKVIEGLTMKEIGEIMEVAPSTVCYRLNGGLTTLAKRLKEARVI